ncbi:unnamed protein product, partial [Heterotrigona itama]
TVAVGGMPVIQKVAKDVFCQTKTALQLAKDTCKDEPKRLYFERTRNVEPVTYRNSRNLMEFSYEARNRDSRFDHRTSSCEASVRTSRHWLKFTTKMNGCDLVKRDKNVKAVTRVFRD